VGVRDPDVSNGRNASTHVRSETSEKLLEGSNSDIVIIDLGSICETDVEAVQMKGLTLR